ncbi:MULTISPECIES: Zn-ribbon domain-containing OB-fold protein [unclassified Phenylobacterium]|uniref:Zn-ribbon domain-containing OB-fold protein n=1 Tax=unclassified Phenylobacterium TaxID=2640670 RepID=UPI00083ADB54|nr:MULTISPECIES: OB-fold domain-containing protein [unclassified Phenylobacterium]
MATAPIADGVFEVVEGGPRLIGGRRKSDGRMVFPLPTGPEAANFEPVRLSPEGTLWSFTIQRFRPKSPPYAGDEDDKSFAPYALGYVELPGEVIVESRLDTRDFAGLRVGQPMRLKLIPFRRADGDVLTYAFEPVA